MGPLEINYEEADDRIGLRGPGLRVTFRRQGVRWDHALTIGPSDSRQFQPAAHSIETDPNDFSPQRILSPAYQELQRHTDSKARCLLLTGQATPHHFSAVVTVRSIPGCVVAVWDVADRCRAPLEVLAATYLVPFGGSDLVDASSDRVVWGGDGLGQGRLEFVADVEGSVVLAEAGRCASRVQVLARVDPATHTQRLAYRWLWTPEAPSRSSSRVATAFDQSGAQVGYKKLPESEFDA